MKLTIYLHLCATINIISTSDAIVFNVYFAISKKLSNIPFTLCTLKCVYRRNGIDERSMYREIALRVRYDVFQMASLRSPLISPIWYIRFSNLAVLKCLQLHCEVRKIVPYHKRSL